MTSVSASVIPEAVSGPVLGGFLSLTDRRVRQLADQGVLARTGRGKYLLKESVFAYHDWRLQTEMAGRSSSQDRVADARTREIELRIAREERKLIDIEEHDEVLVEIIGIIKSGCMSLPARCTRDLDLRRKIETEVDLVFAKASETCQQRSEDLRSTGNAEFPVEEVE